MRVTQIVRIGGKLALLAGCAVFSLASANSITYFYGYSSPSLTGWQTQDAFARQRGVPVSSLRYWLYKGRQRRTGGSRVGLVPVAVTTAAGHFEARVGDVGLRFDVGTEPGYVVALLQGLLRPC